MTKARDLANIISGGFDATDIPNLDTAKITSGTFVDARIPNLDTAKITSGTLADARFPATLPAVSGVNLTNLPNTGITEADQWRLTASITSNTQPISSNLERVDDGAFAKIGTGMSVSSGIWSFPVTGLYLIIATMNSTGATADNHVLLTRATTDNGSNYDDVINVVSASVSSQHAQGSGFGFINVTNTTNVKIKFEATSIAQGSVQGSTNTNYTCFTFIRLGDSQ
jgi:hypothetical protein